jgi:type IV pilus biogenesis protein CpaD/CtpE
MRIAIFAVAAFVGLTACADTQGPLNPGFGDAYQHNMAVQVIDPNPANAGSGAPDLEGERARVAIDRYRGAATLAPVTTTTSEE